MSRKKKAWIAAVLIGAAVAAAAIVFVGAVKRHVSPVTPVICLDAGHGGSDTGAIAGERLEKDDDLRMTLAVGKILEEKGYQVVYTRTDDSTVSLQERCDICNRNKATVFVAIHRNSAANANANGIEAWIKNTAPRADKKLAKNILKHLSKVGFGKNRGVNAGYRGDKTKNYAVNSGTNCKSCLLELGFMTSAADNERFDKNFDAYANAIAEAIIQSS